MTQSPTQPPSAPWHLQETYKSLITISVECLKMLAIVTYLGNLVGRAPTQPLGIHIKPALLWYCGGLLATVLAFVLSYLVQLQLFNEESALYSGRSVRRKHQWLLWL